MSETTPETPAVPSAVVVPSDITSPPFALTAEQGIEYALGLIKDLGQRVDGLEPPEAPSPAPVPSPPCAPLGRHATLILTTRDRAREALVHHGISSWQYGRAIREHMRAETTHQTDTEQRETL